MKLDVDWQVYHSHPTQGHAFREGSLLPGDLAPEEADLILDFTDRTPGYGDFRTSWAPYPGGRRAGRFYVVTSTRPDSEAVRPGSVVTQALLVPLERFAQLPDLQSALEAVSAPWPASGPRTLTLADSAPANPNVGYVMTEAFIRASGQQVAVVGEELWAEAVSGLWRALWPGARQDFQFRAFETPHYLVGNPDLLLVPAPGQAWAPPAWTGVAVRALVSSGPVPAALEFVATSAAQIFVRWAVRQPGPHSMEAAAQALRDVPALLVEADLREGRWLDLWTAALPHWSEVDPGHRRADVLTLVAEGMPVPPALLVALAQHGGGNLLAHPQRSLLLSRLPAEYRSQTADAYLRCQDDPGVPEGVLLNAVQERLLLVPPSPSVVRRLITLPALTAEAQRVVERHLAQSLQADDEPLLARLAPAQFARLLQGAPQAVRWHLRRHLDSIDAVRLAHQLSRPVDEATWWAALEALLMTSEIDALSVWRELSWPTRDFPVRGSQRDHWQHGLTEIRHASSDTLDRFLGVLAHRRPHSMFPAMQVTFREIRRPH